MGAGWEEHDFLFRILGQDTGLADPQFIGEQTTQTEVAELKRSAARRGQPRAKPQAGTDGVCGTYT